MDGARAKAKTRYLAHHEHARCSRYLPRFASDGGAALRSQGDDTYGVIHLLNGAQFRYSTSQADRDKENGVTQQMCAKSACLVHVSSSCGRRPRTGRLPGLTFSHVLINDERRATND